MAELIFSFGGYSLLGVIFSWLAILTFILVVMIIRYRRLTRGVKNKDFDKILREVVRKTDNNGVQLKKSQELIYVRVTNTAQFDSTNYM